MRGFQLLSKVVKLKEKNKKANQEKRHLKQKVKDLEQGRDKWRKESLALRQENKKLRKELSLRKGGESLNLREKAKYHSYPIFIIYLVLRLRQISGLGYRKCSEVLELFYEILDLDLKVPCATTISNWVVKYGLHQLQDHSSLGIAKVLLLDESISVGQKKALLLQSINLQTYQFGKSPTHQDTELFGLAISQSWKGKEIAKIIEDSPLKADIAYAVCDGANNLDKALCISGIEKVYDLTHMVGAQLKKRYGKREDFLAFSKAATSFKQKVVLGKHAVLMPPVQRPKARFLNISALVKWAQKILQLLEGKHLDADQTLELQWILAYKPLIEELAVIDKLILKIFKLVKSQGLNVKTKRTCLRWIRQSKVEQELKQAFKNYFCSYNHLIKKHGTIICCSDVIESTFGKFKNRIAANKMNSITGAALEMGTYGVEFDPSKVKQVLQQISIKDIKEWKKENKADNLYQKRRQLMKKVA